MAKRRSDNTLVRLLTILWFVFVLPGYVVLVLMQLSHEISPGGFMSGPVNSKTITYTIMAAFMSVVIYAILLLVLFAYR